MSAPSREALSLTLGYVSRHLAEVAARATSMRRWDAEQAEEMDVTAALLNESREWLTSLLGEADAA